MTGVERQNTAQRQQQHSLSFLKYYYSDTEDMVWSTSEHNTNLRSCVYFFGVESHESRFSGGSSNTGFSGDTEILHLKVTDKGISGFCATSLSKQASFGEL